MKYRTQGLRYGLRRFARQLRWSRLLLLLLGLASLPVRASADTVSGVVSGGKIQLGETQDVVSGGIAIGVEDDGTQNVSAGGQTSGTFGTGVQNVYSGGLASGTGMTGTQNVYTGGVASSTVVSGLFQNVVGGRAVSTTVLSSGSQRVSAGGVAVSTTLLGSGAGQGVVAGGSASVTMVGSGATQTVLGGSASDNTILSGGLQQVLLGGTASQNVVSAGGRQDVGTGGTARQTMVDAGGVQNVAGVAIDNQLNGGTQNITSGGVASATVVTSAGAQNVSAGGTASGTQINSGTQSVFAGGSANQTIIAASGAQNVQGSVSNTVVNGGSQAILAGMASATTLNSGASQLVGGGVADGNILNGDSNQSILSGGVASNTVLNDSNQNVGAGGRATSTTVGSGSDQTVEGVASATTVQSGGRQFVSAGGVADTTTVNGGSQNVFSGALASATTLTSGIQRVAAGGSATTTTMGAGVDQNVSGTVTSTTVNGGRQFVEAGGLASGNTFNGGTQQITSGGQAIGNTLTSASQFVLAGGVASSTALLAGGRQTVSLGGTANSVTVSGGRLLNNGGVVSGLTMSGSAGLVQQAAGTLEGATVVAGSGNQLLLQGGVVRGSVTASGSNNAVGIARVDLSGVSALEDESGQNRLVLLSGAQLSAATAALNGGSVTSGVSNIGNWGFLRINSGAALVMAGNLGLAPAGSLAVSGTLSLPNSAELTGSLDNAGTLSLGSPGNYATLTVKGNYSGNNGLLLDNVSANGDRATLLNVSGDVAGTTRVAFSNDGTPGKLGEFIEFVSAPNDSAATAASFVAANPLGAKSPQDVRLKGSPFVWTIARDGNNWFLQSPSVPPTPVKPIPSEPPTPVKPIPPEPLVPVVPDRLLPEIPAYGILPAVSDILLRGNLMSLGQRLDATPSVDRDVWVKTDGFRMQQDRRNGFAFDGFGTALTVGGDRHGQLADGKNWRAGVFAAWNQTHFDVNGDGELISSRATSNLKLNSLQAGVYGQLDQNGWYGRGIALGGREHAKVRTEDRYSNTLHANIWALHLAAGKVLDLAPGWRLIPQVNASYADFDWDLVDYSIKGRYDKSQHWYGGAGLRVEKVVDDSFKVWLRPGVTHQFGDRAALALSAPDVYLPAAGSSTTWQLQAGFNKDTRWGGYYGLLGGSWAKGQQLGRLEAGWRWLW